ncbi:diaminopimelate epimerase [Clostridium tetanomorphum]|uniref:Diaminopimelate epimerase n=1 Tax=Clostridium tetanomorphum TaxID=1553 RepID=A0A923EAR5_CLOTT|nr:diaminopimelate epimerase [Clostridium tetanomorphum]
MKLHFIKVNPVENMTVFVLDQVPRDVQMNVAKKLMNYNSIYAEQVGFIEKANLYKETENKCLRLQMMGGEFCGNATRALAAFLVHNQYPYFIKEKDKFKISLEVSGAEKLVDCEVYKTENDNEYMSKVYMPLPNNISKFSLEENDTVFSGLKVEFSGITHFIVDSKKIKNKEELFKLVKREMDNRDYDAFGIMYYDYNENYLEPLVYVRGTESLFWERSCASGTSALGAALAYMRNESIEEKIKQPGGELEIIAEFEENKITNICLNGLVQIVAEGIVNV